MGSEHSNQQNVQTKQKTSKKTQPSQLREKSRKKKFTAFRQNDVIEIDLEPPKLCGSGSGGSSIASTLTYSLKKLSSGAASGDSFDPRYESVNQLSPPISPRFLPSTPPTDIAPADAEYSFDNPDNIRFQIATLASLNTTHIHRFTNWWVQNVKPQTTQKQASLGVAIITKLINTCPELKSYLRQSPKLDDFGPSQIALISSLCGSLRGMEELHNCTSQRRYDNKCKANVQSLSRQLRQSFQNMGLDGINGFLNWTLALRYALITNFSHRFTIAVMASFDHIFNTLALLFYLEAPSMANESETRLCDLQKLSDLKSFDQCMALEMGREYWIRYLHCAFFSGSAQYYELYFAFHKAAAVPTLQIAILQQFQSLLCESTQISDDIPKPILNQIFQSVDKVLRSISNGQTSKASQHCLDPTYQLISNYLTNETCACFCRFQKIMNTL